MENWLQEQGRFWLVWAGAVGQGPRGLAEGLLALSCELCLGPSSLWLLLQEVAAWAAVPRQGGVRVAAGRGCSQECVSRNVAALPTEMGGGRSVVQGGGPWPPAEQDRFVSPWLGWGLPLVPAL